MIERDNLEMVKTSGPIWLRREFAIAPAFGDRRGGIEAGWSETPDDLRTSKGIAMAVLLSMYVWSFGGLAIWLW